MNNLLDIIVCPSGFEANLQHYKCVMVKCS